MQVHNTISLFPIQENCFFLVVGVVAKLVQSYFEGGQSSVVLLVVFLDVSQFLQEELLAEVVFSLTGVPLSEALLKS
jgi:hypothetical protein